MNTHDQANAEQESAAPELPSEQPQAQGFSPFELRVLGVLIEKKFLTPDIYPMSLNQIVNACNQLTAREPIMSLGEPAVQETLNMLIERRWAAQRQQAGARVVKYEHRAFQRAELDDEMTAVLSVLLLRGAQTVGEIKQRTERMVQWSSLGAVDAALQRLSALTPALAVALPKAPGTKEPRYLHCLSDAHLDFAQQDVQDGNGQADVVANKGRIGALEDEVAQLKRELEWLTQTFLDFKKTFE